MRMYGATLLALRFRIAGISRLSCTGGFSQGIMAGAPMYDTQTYDIQTIDSQTPPS